MVKLGSPQGEKPKFITESVENYLKAIYQIDYHGEGAPVQEIASRLDVSAPGVTKMLRQLGKYGLVDHTPYRPVKLTEVGEKIALEVIRHHRLLELYLTQSLGYGWDQVHDEADRLEHYISEEFEETIDRLLGFPSHDPHGDPIPTRDGQVPLPVIETLASQADGARVTVRRVTDESPELLRYLGERNIRPCVPVLLVSREPFGGSLLLDVDGREERISPEAARHVFVELLPDVKDD